MTLPPHPEELILPARGSARGSGVGSLPDAATICSCLHVTKGTICSAIARDKLTTPAAIKSCTKAGTGCGSCVTLLSQLLAKSGVTVDKRLCEHFTYSRQELYSLVRLHQLRSFEG